MTIVRRWMVRCDSLTGRSTAGGIVLLKQYNTVGKKETEKITGLTINGISLMVVASSRTLSLSMPAGNDI